VALNIQTLKTRALTALIFVAVMLFGLLFNYWSFFILFSIIHFGCWVEYQKMIGLIDPAYKNISAFHKYAIMLCGFGFMLWNVESRMQPFDIPLSEIGKWLLAIIAVVLPVKEIVLSKKDNAKVVAHSFFGFLYISICWSLMISLRNKGMIFKGNFLFLDFGYVTPMILIASIWINDTMAYIVGSLIGKTPLTKVSPKKTWEGTIGGAILAVVAVTAICYFFVSKTNIYIVVYIAAIGAVIGTLGDLLESKLKRLANVKDSGSFMPGHGGFLDRFDSLLLATPFVWLLLQLI